MIYLMTRKHWPEVKRIYQEGIDTGNATFEEAPPKTWNEWSSKHIPSSSLVAVNGKKVIGWATLSPVSQRCVYKGVAEVSVYVDKNSRGKGVGSILLKKLIATSEKIGIWALQAGIFPENMNSVKLHAKFGFRKIGMRNKLGKMTFGPMAGKWRNVLLMERRSAKIGIN